MAQAKVDATQGMLNESSKIRTDVEKMLSEHRDDFNKKIQENEQQLSEIDNQVSNLGSRIADINEMVGLLIVLTIIESLIKVNKLPN